MSVSRLWPCQRCTFQNKPTDKKCKMCFLPHDAAGDQTKTWQCWKCCAFSPVTVTKCSRCDLNLQSLGEAKEKTKGIAPGEEARWICERPDASGTCGTVNSIDLSFCSQCQGRKPYFAQLLSEKQMEQQLQEAMTDVHIDSSDSKERSNPAIPWQRETSMTTADQPKGSLAAGLQSVRTGESLQSTQERGMVFVAVPDSKEGRAAAAAAAAGGPECDPSVQAAPVDDEVLEFPDKECRLVLVGKTGNGKSHTANTILGLHRFHHDPSFHSVTTKCQRHNNLRFGVRLEVVDTPGLFDTELDQETVKTEIAKCLGVIAPGPHAIVVVLRIGVKFTEEEIQTVEKLDEIFGVQLIRFLVIAFTHGDQLDRRGNEDEEAAVKRMLEASPEKLKELVQRVNNRYVVFNNMAGEDAKARQVKKLIRTISRLLAVNGGRPYTTNLLDMVERCMHDREVQLEEQLQPRGGRGQRQRGNDQDRQGSINFMFRDMARDEVVQESGSLLQQIKTKILPIVLPALQMLATMLLKRLVDHATKNSSCSIQ